MLTRKIWKMALAPLRRRFSSNSNILSVSECDGIRRIVMNSPKTRNSLSMEMMDSLLNCLENTCDPTLRCVILSSEGSVFSSGHNLKELAEDGRARHKETFAKCAKLCMTISTIEVPVIAAVNGIAAAAGCQLAVACDMVVATQRSSFSTPGANFGLFCSGPGVIISRTVGRKAAAKMLLTGLPIPAAEAFNMGLISHVCDNDELGPGGATVARRLAEVKDNKVLLLEAGDDPPVSSDIPHNSGSYPTKSLMWNFKTAQSEQDCLGFNGRSCPLAVGRALGGSSVVNIMLYVRGNPEDFNEIAALGNSGWSYENMLPYFKKLENYVAQPMSDINLKYHNKGGPMTTTYFPIDPLTHQIHQAIAKTLTDVGILENVDYNGRNQKGHATGTGMVDEAGYRFSAAKAYLTRLPDNLKVCKGSTAIKIIIKDKRAIGLEFIFKNETLSKKYIAKARKDHIISGGPYNSPALLERSGIGRKDILTKAGVHPIHDLQGVGENLQDHYINLAAAFKFNPLTQTSPNPLSIGITALTAFINTTDPDSRTSDTQFVFPVFSTQAYALYGNMKPEVRRQFEKAGMVLVFGGIPLREKTPGSTHITQASDPNKTPLIKQSAYSVPEEIEQVVKVTRKIREIFKHPNLEPFKIEPIVLNECKKYLFNSEKEIMCGARMLTRPMYHAVGSNSMGPEDNPMAVVDPRLLVHGLNGLRVVDSSVLPLTIRGNTEIPTIAVAEKAADIIKEDYRMY